jgi:peptidoglycan/xylan/chitin deacetylase (PgdA/CDA1 family)
LIRLAFFAAGGDFENHTLSYPDMTKPTEAQDLEQ